MPAFFNRDEFNLALTTPCIRPSKSLLISEEHDLHLDPGSKTMELASWTQIDGQLTDAIMIPNTFN